MCAFSEPNFNIDVKICHTLHYNTKHSVFNLVAQRLEHLSCFECKLLVNEQSYDLGSILVRKAVAELVQDLTLARWVCLCELLEVSGKLPNYSVIINLVCLFLDHIFEWLRQPMHALFERDFLCAGVRKEVCFINFKKEFRLFECRGANKDLNLMLLFQDRFCVNYVIFMERVQSKNKDLV